MCEIRLTKLSCAAQWVGTVHFYAVTEIKGLSCRLWWMREWRKLLTSTHLGCRSVIRAVASGASLKFGVQGASATNWFSRVNGAQDNGIRLYMDVACEVSSDRLGSDHHPIIITANTSDYPVPQRVPKWNFKKAKWDAFQDQCIAEITPDLFNDAEDKMAIFSSALLDIAADNIPKTSPFPKRKAKPWFDEDCQAAKKERNKANRLANKHPSAANSMRARLIQARTKKLFKQKKRDSWKNYVSSVNVNTPSKKVWDMIRKITGKM